MKHATMTVVSKGKTLKVSEKASFFLTCEGACKTQNELCAQVIIGCSATCLLEAIPFKTDVCRYSLYKSHWQGQQLLQYKSS